LSKKSDCLIGYYIYIYINKLKYHFIKILKSFYPLFTNAVTIAKKQDIFLHLSDIFAN